MRVIHAVSAALLSIGALTFSAPAAVASGGAVQAYGGGDHYGGSGYDDDGGGGRSYGGGGYGDDEGGRGGHGSGRPEHYRHGVHAGGGGTVAGFDLKEVGMGSALIAGSLGAAYCLARRRPGEEGVA
ncbi:hypothetical protein [Streptomyces thermodiastaticus]|jgi:hypothetical protein|uniref:hypothetical protein n=1 Tax=Streptomyces thermodiastaticus TaxID=44061 RepID=UPI001672A94D|nr:hypothetical protein [Streptomyces thermodiastaticus]MCE7551983.1 hypothetical protein [Streptomyces thermodiastaticus]GHF78842.1 hypothetical protein GCM10018787_29610 [Streptomyces thermodiastaticus]